MISRCCSLRAAPGHELEATRMQVCIAAGQALRVIIIKKRSSVCVTWPVHGHDDAAAPLCAGHADILLQVHPDPEVIDVHAHAFGR